MWLVVPRHRYTSKLICDTRNKIKTMFMEANNRYNKNENIKKMLKDCENYFDIDIDMDDISIQKYFKDIIAVLINNKQQLLEHQKVLILLVQKRKILMNFLKKN